MTTKNSRKRHWMFAITLVVIGPLTFAVFWQHYAAQAKLPGAVAVLTTPLGELVQARSLDQSTTPPKTKRATVPLTGGAPTRDKEKEAKVAPQNPPAPLPQLAPRTPEARDPDAVSNQAIVLAQPQKRERVPETLATEPNVGEQPKFAMQPGAVIPNGGQAPALRLSISSSQVRNLLGARRAIVVVIDAEGKDALFLDDPDGAFKPTTELDTRGVSERYVPITDPGLIAIWSVRLGPSPGTRSYGLRFTRSFDAKILERQFASLVAQHLDFSERLAAGVHITTDVYFDPELEPMIGHVSIQEPARPAAK